MSRYAQRRPRRLAAQPLAEASAWLERYRQHWEANFRKLDVLLDAMQAQERLRTQDDIPSPEEQP